ncbi:MAG: WcaF family extracellular polysaccharide biosynthesis acetyltransferase [Bryobacteraceae bacterium]
MGSRGEVNLSTFRVGEFSRGRPRWIEAAWLCSQGVLFSTWLPGSRWRVGLLRLFGAHIGHGVVIKPGVRVKFPWRLRIGDHSWIGESAWLDDLCEISIGWNCCVSQGAYLCTGNHDWSDPSFRLILKPIVLCDGAWVGAHAIVCPGVTLGEQAVAAAGSVVTKDIPAFEIHAGNPAAFTRRRILRPAPQP